MVIGNRMTKEQIAGKIAKGLVPAGGYVIEHISDIKLSENTNFSSNLGHRTQIICTVRNL
jgi:hypothetical protein